MIHMENYNTITRFLIYTKGWIVCDTQNIGRIVCGTQNIGWIVGDIGRGDVASSLYIFIFRRLILY